MVMNQFSVNNPQSINNAIKFQEGSVVSKEIINKSAGSVTFFAFDKGQGLSEHTAPFDALVIITDGAAEITISGLKNIVKTGEMILMPANSSHELKAIEAFKMILVMIKS